jgi:hypothetical protein
MKRRPQQISLGIVALLVALIAVLAPAGEALAGEDPAGWWMGLTAGIGTADGQVRVGEPSPSTPLALGDDLGIGHLLQVGISVDGHLSSAHRLHFSFESLPMSGSKEFEKTVYFDEGVFPAGSTPGSDPRFYLADFEYARVFARPAAPSRWLLLAGVDYAYLDFRIGDQSENFYKQEVPMPVLGAGWERKLGKSAVFQFKSKGFRYNHLNTGEKEGGTVYLSQVLWDTSAGVSWSSSPRTSWNLAYRFLYFSQTETSNEDFNDFVLRSHGLQATFSIRF